MQKIFLIIRLMNLRLEWYLPTELHLASNFPFYLAILDGIAPEEKKRSLAVGEWLSFASSPVSLFLLLVHIVSVLFLTGPVLKPLSHATYVLFLSEWRVGNQWKFEKDLLFSPSDLRWHYYSNIILTQWCYMSFFSPFLPTCRFKIRGIPAQTHPSGTCVYIQEGAVFADNCILTAFSICQKQAKLLLMQWI